MNPGIDYAVGGSQGLDAQEEEEKVTCWHRPGHFREQLEGRASQSKKGFVCLIVTFCDLTLLHGTTSICSLRCIGLNEARALLLRPVPFPTFSRSFFLNFSRSIFSKNCMRNWLAWHRSQRHPPFNPRGQLTGLENHLPPPISNQLRCPPSEVVHNSTKGFCWNS